MKKTYVNITATALGIFGLLTFFLSASVIFDLFSIRAKEGNFVLFVVWANFISSFLHLFAAYIFIKNQKRTIQALGLSSIILIIAFVGLLIWVGSGGIHESKTISAMMFRIALTLVFTGIAFLTINKKNK